MSKINTVIGFAMLSGCMASCSILEKASVHGLTSDVYIMRNKGDVPIDVYLDVTNEQIDFYRYFLGKPQKPCIFTIPLNAGNSTSFREVVVEKQGLDVDITSILLKYRPSVNVSPAQLNTDLNVAVYAGWRRDLFRINTSIDPLGKRYPRIRNLGYDFGIFAGPGTTAVSPFSTGNVRSDEYEGMVFQAGIAGFVESSVASFGVSIGYDHLLSPDRSVWIYRNKPWVGFIVGIALR
ncbi:MAG: hypothetical protein EBV05_14080 [Cyanobacteria bacterium WB6_1B_304]|nr:hypothetical protein [Cyanobacteria bacterium WB6_1B_304]